MCMYCEHPTRSTNDVSFSGGTAQTNLYPLHGTTRLVRTSCTNLIPMVQWFLREEKQAFNWSTVQICPWCKRRLT